MAKTTKRTCKLLKQALTLVFAVLIISCKTIQPSTEITHVHDTVYKTKTEYVEKVDSFFREKLIYIKGDTVFINSTKIEYRYRYRDRTDTLYQTKDSLVYLDKEVPVEVVKYKISIWTILGWVLFILTIAAIIKKKIDKAKYIL